VAATTIVEDYGDREVPAHARHSAGRIGITTGAWIIAVSTFFTGGVLATGLSFWHAVLAALCGQMILGCIGSLTALAGARRRLSTAMITWELYGAVGGRFVGLLIAFVLGLGWFAWQLGFFAQTIHASFAGYALTTQNAAIIWGALLTTVSVLFGFRLLSILSAFAVPAIVLLSFYGLDLSVQRIGGIAAVTAAEARGAALPIMKAISLVVGHGIVGTVMFPDLARFARRPLTGALAAGCCYAVAGFVILVAGAVIVYAAGAPPGDLPGAMQAVGMGLPAFLVLIVAQWATNKGNLYSGVLCFVAATRVNQRYATIALGLLGMLVALAGFQNHFVPLLTFLGNFMPPIAAAMIVHVLLLPSDHAPCRVPLAAILGGGGAGYTVDYLQLPVPAALLAFVTGGALHWAIARRVGRARRKPISIGPKPIP
jgi:cytosine permease